MGIAIIILGALVLALLWRLQQTRQIISQLIEAAEESTPVLMERKDRLIRGFKLDALVKAFNSLITEKASISVAGEERLNQIRTTLGNLREAVVMVDSSNTIRLANPAFSELLGVEGSSIGERLDNFIHGESFHQFLVDIRANRVGQRKEIEARIGKKDLWLEVSAANLEETPQSDGPLTLFFFHDVTRQKALEKMRTEFVANVSHELRTPVTVIKGFAETLIEDGEVLENEEKIRFLRKIVVNADRQHGILQDLLLLSRLESTEMVLSMEDISVSAFLKEISENWEYDLDPEKQTLEMNFDEGRDIVRADPLRLSQVMTNLFENIHRHARDFTRIKLGSVVEDGEICFHIEDDGPGIPESDLPHIFQRFYRVDKGRSRESGGTGLGLAIVKHIVVQHEGTIQAFSRKGEGTRIEIRLPLAVEQVS